MTVLNLSRGKGTMCVPLRLPASGSEVKRAFDLLLETTGKGVTRIRSVTSPVSNLENYLKHIDISDPDERAKLNMLAEKIDGMSASEQKMFGCVLDARIINGLNDVLSAADALDDYVYHPQITNERELGVFVVESGLMDVPERLRPYMDYQAIGIEYHAEHSGALTLDGYVVRRSEAPQEQKKEPVFRVLLWSEAMREQKIEPYSLMLPAASLELEQARQSVSISDFADADIVQAQCLDPRINGNLTMEYPDVEVMQKLGLMIQKLLYDAGQLNKFLAILSVEQPEAMTDVLELVENIDLYSLFSDDAEAYGQETLKLNHAGADDELIAELDGFTDWNAYGRYMMEADGVRITKYGLLRREEKPFPAQDMGQQIM